MENAIITICNKLKRQDSVTGIDVWYKTFGKAIYKKTLVQSIVNTDVSVGQSHTILIPFDDKYRPYEVWKTLSNKEDYYTMSQGDYIFIGEISDDVNPQTIVKLRTQYLPNVCEVRAIEEVEQKYGARIRLRVTGV